MIEITLDKDNWEEQVKEAFKNTGDKVIAHTKDWSEIDFDSFNMVCRILTTNVSYGKDEQGELIHIGKILEDVVFDLDDMSEEHNPMPTLLDLKYRFPKLKVSLFCILSKCPDEWIKEIKDKCGDWIQFCLHGDLHDTEHGNAQETNFWTAEQMNEYLDKAEAKGLYEKVFRAPGWGYNWETVKVLADRGYIIAEHLGHDRWEEFGGKRYTTGHLMEVHGHTWECNMNGVKELATTKCNFGENTNFYFITEAPLDAYLPGRYQ